MTRKKVYLKGSEIIPFLHTTASIFEIEQITCCGLESSSLWLTSMQDLNANKKTDLELWYELINDDEDAISTLFLRYYSDLLSYGCKVADTAKVEDAIQDIFLTLWKQRKGLSNVQAVRSYLFKSLRWRILRYQTSERRRSFRNEKYFQDLPPFSLSHEEFLISKELEQEGKKLLDRALSQLSSRQRETIYLRFFNGLKYKEIADVMGVNNQTVRNYVFEALQTLRKHLLMCLPLLMIQTSSFVANALF